jgi:hypothetical protein
VRLRRRRTEDAAPVPEAPAPAPAGADEIVRALGELRAGLSALVEVGERLAAHLVRQQELLARVVTPRRGDSELTGVDGAVDGAWTVLGGSVDPSRPARRLDGRVPGTDVEVRCVWDGGWVGGFEVVEVLECRDGLRFRLLRRSDRSVLPVLFDDTEVRVAPTPRPEAEPVLDLTDPALAGSAREDPGAPDGPAVEAGLTGAPDGPAVDAGSRPPPTRWPSGW